MRVVPHPYTKAHTPSLYWKIIAVEPWKQGYLCPPPILAWIGETMKILGLYLLAFVCLALPSPKDYAAGQLSKKQYQCLLTLWTKESNWRSNAQSKTHDMGIPQRHMKHNTKKQQQKFLSDPLAQIDWGINYIKIRYHTPCRALAAWMSRADHRGVGGWY